MRILQVLTYYRPHVSGLTIYVERLVRGLVKAGHDVTVQTMGYDSTLPREEMIDGARVVRVPVAVRLSKGVIAPSFGQSVRRLMPQHDLVHMHLPQFDGAGLALNAKLARKPSLLTYHCDIQLPPGLFNAVVQPVIDTANDIAARNIDQIVAYTEDYAKHSALMSRFLPKVTVIPPPVEIESPSADDIAAVRAKFSITQRPIIGMVARLATEKGVEVLLDALALVRQTQPDARVIFVGQYQNVLGEAEYGARIMARVAEINKQGEHWTFAGLVRGRELAALYGAMDVHVLPSLNSTESFGLVQVEAMMSGTPSICSALPGVRVSVQTTGMGEVVPIGDAPALAEAILKVCANRERYVKTRDVVESHYSTRRTVEGYEALYHKLLSARPR